jgi:hypothetical protein
MAIQQFVPRSLFAKTFAIVIAILGTAYVSWIIFAVYVLDPKNYARNDANYSWSGALFVVAFLTLAISTIFLSRYVMARIDGRSVNSKKFYALAIVTMLIPFPIAPVSPTTMIFFVFAWMLLWLNWTFGRSPQRQLAT